MTFFILLLVSLIVMTFFILLLVSLIVMASVNFLYLLEGHLLLSTYILRIPFLIVVFQTKLSDEISVTHYIELLTTYTHTHTHRSINILSSIIIITIIVGVYSHLID